MWDGFLSLFPIGLLNQLSLSLSVFFVYVCSLKKLGLDSSSAFLAESSFPSHVVILQEQHQQQKKRWSFGRLTVTRARTEHSPHATRSYRSSADIGSFAVPYIYRVGRCVMPIRNNTRLGSTACELFVLAAVADVKGLIPCVEPTTVSGPIRAHHLTRGGGKKRIGEREREKSVDDGCRTIKYLKLSNAFFSVSFGQSNRQNTQAQVKRDAEQKRDKRKGSRRA